MKNSYDLIVLPGDGIGVEVASAARALLNVVSDCVDVRFAVEEIPCGGQFYLQDGQRDWPVGSEERCKQADVILLGAVGWPDPSKVGPVTMAGGKMAGYSPVIGNRVALDLYANIRKVKLLDGVQHRICGKHQQVWQPGQVDMVFVRENTEGLYSGMGGTLSPGGEAMLATDTRVITRHAAQRVIRKAFALCDKRAGAPRDGTKRVTCIVKDNVLQGCKLFAQVFEDVGKEFPEIEKDFAIVDAFTQWLLTQPDYYDVCVTTNMFGDIVTDLASVLQGGMGLAVGCNVGDKHAMFEPIHGSAPKHAGKDKANPMAMLLSTGEALLWLGDRHQDERLRRAGEAIEQGVAAITAKGAPLTYDLVGTDKAAPMSEVSQAVSDEVRGLLS